MKMVIDSLTALEEKNGNLTKIEVNEVLSFMCHVTAEITTNNAVPSGVVLFVELLLDVSGDILLNTIL